MFTFKLFNIISIHFCCINICWTIKYNVRKKNLKKESFVNFVKKSAYKSMNLMAQVIKINNLKYIVMDVVAIQRGIAGKRALLLTPAIYSLSGALVIDVDDFGSAARTAARRVIPRDLEGLGASPTPLSWAGQPNRALQGGRSQP